MNRSACEVKMAHYDESSLDDSYNAIKEMLKEDAEAVCME